MSFEEFQDGIIKKLDSDGYKVTFSEPTKAGDVSYKGLVISSKNNEGYSCAPVISMELLQEFHKSYSLEDAYSKIKEVIQATKGRIPGIENIEVYKEIRSKIRCRLLNPNINKRYLENAIWAPYLDLAIVPYIYWNDRGEYSSLITKSILKTWKVSSKEVIREGCRNVQNEEINAFPIGIPLGGLPTPEGLNMRVLTSERGLYGANIILKTGTLDKVSKEYGGKFWLIPSSVHEFITVGYKGTESCYDDFKMMIDSANKEVLKSSDILSDHPYLYDPSTHEIQYERRTMEHEKIN